MLGDGIAYIEFAPELQGQDFTYIDGATGLESAAITYNHVTGWTIPVGVKVYDILFQGTELEDKPIYFCMEYAGFVLFDSGGYNHHAKIFNASASVRSTQIYRSDINEKGYSTKAQYTFLGLDWELPDGTVLDDDCLIPRGLFGYETLVDSGDDPISTLDDQIIEVIDPFEGDRDDL